MADSELVSINPADGSVAGTVAVTTPAQLDAAASRADRVFRTSGWKDWLPHRRAAVLRAIADGIEAEKEPLAHLQMRDNGKPLAECRAMADYAAATFRYYASACETLETAVTPPRGQYLSLTVMEPHGVVAAITPWNSPLMNDATKVAPALAAGNAVLLKPSEHAPLLAPELLRICLAAGLPEGQLQVIQGAGPAVGAALVAHPVVRMVSFTGGTATGRAIARAAAERLIPVALELGGKSPHIVFADARRDHAIAAVVAGIFGSAGQSCVAGSRVFVEAPIYEEVLQAIVARARAVRVRNPDDPTVEMGPLAFLAHRDRVAAFVDMARGEGGRVLCGGKGPDDPSLSKGAFYLPTVIDGLGYKAKACQDEAFGPVLLALPFSGEDDLIAQANGTPHGLACGIWTEDFRKAWRLGRALDAGSVWINTYKQSVPTTPFGGFKESGIGREKGLGGYALYAQVKSMYFGLQDQPMPIAR